MRSHESPRISLDDVRAGVRLVRDLPRFLAHPIAAHDARAALATRLRHREQDFLELVRRAVYGQKGSPYRTLLGEARCEYDDLERLVRAEGVDEALARLARLGVYLTVDELKGRRPLVRGGTTITVAPGSLWNPLVRAHALAQSSGSRGERGSVPVELGFVRDLGANICLTTDARGGMAWRHATWTIPGGAAMAAALSYSAFGAHWTRWFSQVDPDSVALHPRYRWSIRALRWSGRLARVSLPEPQHVPLDDPGPVARWMAATLAAGATPHLLTFPSSAVRVCEAAREAGIGLEGARFMVGGEPITAARLAVVERAGGQATAGYGTAETGPCGLGDACLTREAPDEVHVFHDLHAVVQVGASVAVPGLPSGALLASSLRRSAPIVLLNVSLGDRAVLTRRLCGCPLERLGWTTHLHTIRSYEKLTAGGMTFLDTDVIRVLEEVLPARFGGVPTHYQLVEEEDASGRPRLRLVVDPAVGALDDRAVLDTFLATLGRGSDTHRLMELVWRGGGFLAVERRPLHATPSGKLLHLHVARAIR
jgi:hypothetical protein